MTTERAALYLRSSKDRSDVSIDSQRRELTALAADRGLLIVAEYADAVESGKDEHRPAFQRLLGDLKRGDRGWRTILVTDTSRLSRRRYVAQALHHECNKRGVRIIFAKVPDVDPISQVILESVLQAMDEVHSLMSREKGLAGMRENVHHGWRAGGRAPWGYRLAHHATGAVRDGEPVSKTTLEPDGHADTARAYLRARAQGTPRTEAMRAAGCAARSASSMVGIDWNALTYAGHTVWNVHAPRAGGAYTGGKKRRPREEWVIQRDTHEALISEPEAEAILRQLEGNKHRQRSVSGDFLLSGLVVTPSGKPWKGDSTTAKGKAYRYYRAAGKRVSADDLDEAIVGQVLSDMRSPAFVRQLAKETRRSAAGNAGDPAAEPRARLVEISAQIDTLMDHASKMKEAGAALRRADALEAERRELAAEVERIESECSRSAALAQITDEQVREILDGIAGEWSAMDQAQIRAMLRAIVERIEMEPDTLECQLRYAIPSEGFGLQMASPRGFEPLSPP